MHAFSITSKDDTAELWHHRLGNLNYKGLTDLYTMVDGMDSCIQPTRPCVDCQITKVPSQTYGIHQQSSSAYSPEENSRAERVNRTLIEGANAILQASHLPKFFWAFAVLTKAYLICRSPHNAVKGKPPYELFYKKRPNPSNLRVFGTSAIVHIPKENRTKLDSKGTEAIFVGYSSAMKAWVFWDHNTGKIIISSSAIFGNEIFTMEDVYKT
jgi:hypothetical protein